MRAKQRLPQKEKLREKDLILNREVDVARMNLLCFGKLEQREQDRFEEL